MYIIIAIANRDLMRCCDRRTNLSVIRPLYIIIIIFLNLDADIRFEGKKPKTVLAKNRC